MCHIPGDDEGDGLDERVQDRMPAVLPLVALKPRVFDSAEALLVDLKRDDDEPPVL